MFVFFLQLLLQDKVTVGYDTKQNDYCVYNVYNDYIQEIMMSDIEQLLEELKEYRAELVHKNYPGKVNEMIINGNKNF